MRGFGTEVGLPQLPREAKPEPLIYTKIFDIAANGQDVTMETYDRPYTHIYVCVYAGVMDLYLGYSGGAERVPEMRFGTTSHPEVVKVGGSWKPITIHASQGLALQATVTLTDYGLCGCGGCKADEELKEQLCALTEQLHRLTSNIGRFK